MKFPQSFLNAIKMTMTNLSARVIINGDLSPRFPVNNGGRQGDPLFPLIYVIALEGLTALIKADTLFKGITSPNPEVIVTNVAPITVITTSNNRASGKANPLSFLLNLFFI